MMCRSLVSVSDVGVSVEPLTDVFVDEEWMTELNDVEVQEIDGTWRGVTLFRHRVNRDHVCMWFGETEYEGMDKDHPYRFCPRSEILEDDDGFEINWRVKGVENDDEDDDDDDNDDDVVV